MRRTVFQTVIPLLLITLIGVACQNAPQQAAIGVTVVIDGTAHSLSVASDTTVADVLRQAGITLSDLDRVNPPSYSRASAGMTITVVRVVEEMTVTQEPLPFERRTTLNDGLATGEKRLLQAGVNGVVEITYRIVYEDGKEVSRTEVKRVVTISPQPEVVMVGSQGQLPPVTVGGTLAYVSSGNAWIIRGNSHDRRPLTLDGGLDGKVFQLSADGKRLLYTRTLAQAASGLAPSVTPSPNPTSAAPGPFNSLWIVPDTTVPTSKPVRVSLNNILYAEFMPNDSSTILYSTAEPRPNFPGWQANNDLWRARINARGAVIETRLLLKPTSGGIYGWYGTLFALSPDGKTVAWSQADSVGVLHAGNVATPRPGEPAEAFTRQTLITFPARRAYDFVWVPTLDWSPDGALIATTLHGPPLGSEAPEDSPVFNTTILPAQGGYSVDLVDRAGMWSAPRYSPAKAPGGFALDVKIAYFQALQALDSVASRYQLVIADRDGSNSRLIFPPKDQPGISPRDAVLTWSPDARQIALIYQGNLYVLDITTGLAEQLTQDGLSNAPQWTP
jgi:hypothetical protein